MSKRDRNALFVALSVMLMLLVGSVSVAGFTPLSRINRRSNPSARRRPHWKKKKKPTSTTLSPLLRVQDVPFTTLRGGAAAAAAVAATFPFTKSLVTKLLLGFLGLNGIFLLLAPLVGSSSSNLYKMIDMDKDTFNMYILQAMGAVLIGMAINVYLVLINNMSIERAMGFGLLARLLYILQSLLLGNNNLENVGGSRKFLSVNTVCMTWATLSLLTGVGNPAMAAKVFSSLACLKGAFLIVNPIAASQKFFGINISNKERIKSQALCRGLGNVLTTSALLMATLAFGVNPIKAAGYTCLLWMLLIVADMVFRITTYNTGERMLSQIIQLFIATFFTVGFLFS